MNEVLYRNQGWIGGRLRKGRKQTYIQSVLAQCVIRWTGLWMFRTTSTETVPNQIEYPLMKMESALLYSCGCTLRWFHLFLMSITQCISFNNGSGVHKSRSLVVSCLYKDATFLFQGSLRAVAEVCVLAVLLFSAAVSSAPSYSGKQLSHGLPFFDY